MFHTQVGGYLWNNIHISNLSLQLFEYLLGPELATVARANVPRIVPAQLVYIANELQYSDGRPRVKPGHWCYDCRQKCKHDGGPVRCERCNIVNDYGATRPLHRHIETVARAGTLPQRIRIEPLQFCSGTCSKSVIFPKDPDLVGFLWAKKPVRFISQIPPHRGHTGASTHLLFEKHLFVICFHIMLSTIPCTRFYFIDRAALLADGHSTAGLRCATRRLAPKLSLCQGQSLCLGQYRERPAMC